MSSTTSPGSDRPSASDANGGSSAQLSRESQYGADTDKRSAQGNYSGSGAQASGNSSQAAGHSSQGSSQSSYSSSQRSDSGSQSAHSNGHDKVHELADQAQQLCHDSMESMKSYIAQHPVSSVGIAMAAGCVLSMMFREQSAMRHNRHH